MNKTAISCIISYVISRLQKSSNIYYSSEQTLWSNFTSLQAHNHRYLLYKKRSEMKLMRPWFLLNVRAKPECQWQLPVSHLFICLMHTRGDEIYGSNTKSYKDSGSSGWLHILTTLASTCTLPLHQHLEFERIKLSPLSSPFIYD